MRALDNKTPHDMLNGIEEMEEVRVLVGRLEHGVVT